MHFLVAQQHHRRRAAFVEMRISLAQTNARRTQRVLLFLRGITIVEARLCERGVNSLTVRIPSDSDSMHAFCVPPPPYKAARKFAAGVISFIF